MFGSRGPARETLTTQESAKITTLLYGLNEYAPVDCKHFLYFAQNLLTDDIVTGNVDRIITIVRECVGIGKPVTEHMLEQGDILLSVKSKLSSCKVSRMFGLKTTTESCFRLCHILWKQAFSLQFKRFCGKRCQHISYCWSKQWSICDTAFPSQTSVVVWMNSMPRMLVTRSICWEVRLGRKIVKLYASLNICLAINTGDAFYNLMHTVIDQVFESTVDTIQPQQNAVIMGLKTFVDIGITGSETQSDIWYSYVGDLIVRFEVVSAEGELMCSSLESASFKYDCRELRGGSTQPTPADLHTDDATSNQNASRAYLVACFSLMQQHQDGSVLQVLNCTFAGVVPLLVTWRLFYRSLWAGHSLFCLQTGTKRRTATNPKARKVDKVRTLEFGKSNSRHLGPERQRSLPQSTCFKLQICTLMECCPR